MVIRQSGKRLEELNLYDYWIELLLLRNLGLEEHFRTISGLNPATVTNFFTFSLAREFGVLVESEFPLIQAFLLLTFPPVKFVSKLFLKFRQMF